MLNGLPVSRKMKLNACCLKKNHSRHDKTLKLLFIKVSINVKMFSRIFVDVDAVVNVMMLVMTLHHIMYLCVLSNLSTTLW